MKYSVELLKNAKVLGKPYKTGELVNVDNDLLEELKGKGLAGAVDEVEEKREYRFLAPYEKITETDIRKELDDLGIDHTGAKDKKAAYLLLEDDYNATLAKATTGE
ncbi:hypothetical protein [Lysinibacillus sp. NPDC047702]|uniref:hypothetical protein n=1 Tax=unclassified Lysinibacillus TaxID=2636778 RepID=UPI003D0104B2